MSRPARGLPTQDLIRSGALNRAAVYRHDDPNCQCRNCRRLRRKAEDRAAPPPAPRAAVVVDVPDDLKPGKLEDLPDGGRGWEPVYDLPQARPQPAGHPVGVQDRMCGDCAFRPDSPEKSGDEKYAGSSGELDEWVGNGHPFWCHQGMRRPVAFRNRESGLEIPASPDSYDPPIIDAVPYKADGTPADLCFGWTARRLHEMTKGSNPE